jgi:hypothetical protein
MRRPPAPLLAALLLSCAHRPAAPAAAPPAGARLAWEVDGHGRLLVEIPAGWTATAGEPEPPLPATLRLEPPAGRPVLLLTPTWDPNAPADAPASPDGAHLLAELARRKVAETSLEVPLPLLELGGGAVGWWFSATDRELGPGGRTPGPEEYRCLVQGVAAVGGLTLSFTLLDDGDGPHRAAALAVVRGARHLPLGAGPEAQAKAAEGQAGSPKAQAAPEEAVPGAPPASVAPAGSATTLAYPGKGWAVAIELPGFTVEPPQRRPDGRLVSLVAHHEATGLVASLVLSDAGTRRTAAACAEGDWLRLSAFVPEIAGRAPPAGPRPRAEYLVRDLRGQRVDQQNLSAWWYRDGVCVHAHVSLMGFEPGDLPAMQRVLATVRFDEPL